MSSNKIETSSNKEMQGDTDQPKAPSVAGASSVYSSYSNKNMATEVGEGAVGGVVGPEAKTEGTAGKVGEISHGRGGAGNIHPDAASYVDAAITRVGEVGAHGDGAFSTGRGGLGNIEASEHPATARKDVEVVPQEAKRASLENEAYHTGRGMGNEVAVHQEQEESRLSRVLFKLNEIFSIDRRRWGHPPSGIYATPRYAAYVARKNQAKNQAAGGHQATGGYQAMGENQATGGQATSESKKSLGNTLKKKIFGRGKINTTGDDSNTGGS